MSAWSKLSVLLVALGVLLATSNAQAYQSGWVAGRWKFYNENGNYCPDERAPCTGAQYVRAQWQTTQPLRNMQVYINNTVAGTIGSGSTDSNGNYNIHWEYSGTLTPAQLAQSRVWVRPWHGAGRFRLNNPSGSYPNNWTGYFTLQVGTTEAIPQQRGSFCVGSCSVVNNHYNAYWAAEMAWRIRLGTSGWFSAYFTDLEIRGFADEIPWPWGNNTCSSSCAIGAENQIQLDDEAALKPMDRIVHEMGHIAIYVSQVWKSGKPWCYQKGNGLTEWYYNTDEHACAGFEEAFASLLPSTTFYTRNATAPHQCLSAGACVTGTWNVETSPACGGVTPGYPLTHLRYLWDVFDAVNDGESLSEDADGRWWRMYRNYQHYTPGTGSFDADEHWNPSYTAIDAFDGRGSWSYEVNYIGNYSYLTTEAKLLNCSPP